MDGRRTRWARHALLVVAVLLAVILAVTSTTGFFGARRAAAAVALAQGDRLAAEIHRRTPGPPGMDVRALERAMEALRDDGLLHVAVLGPSGRTVAEAGDALAQPGRAPAGLPRFLGDRVRMVVGEPPPGAPPRPADAPPALLIEFEIGEAGELAFAGLRDLILGLLAACALVVAAAVAWRIGRRAEVAEQALVEQRHLAALGELSAIMAHEIRNPLAALKGHAQLLEERLEPQDPNQRTAARVVAGAERLEALTRDLLAFARDAELERARVDPVELVAQAADLVAPSRISVDATAAPPEWSLDAGRIRQVLVNVFENAVEASGDEGDVDVSVGVVDTELELSVRDRGPGIPAELRERLFEPFVTGKTRGTGLGLAVAARVVGQHGGRIHVEDAAGGGTRFRILLPSG